MAALVAEKDVRAIVDASHPYATQASANAKAVAEERGIPCLRWLRPAVLSRSGAVCRAADHPSAARLAFSFGRPVLLTTGSRNLAPYARESSRTGISLVVRVLSHPESIAACERFGIPHERVLTGRGPFSMEDNLTVIRAFDIGVVVTKDSGAAGGVAEKLEAAAQENCRVVVVERPAVPSGAEIHDVEELVRTLGEALTKDGPGVP
jgi:precorrin-6A/cobalt-precorrin-6A reductase